MLTIFQCAPIRAFWTYPALPNQRCFVEGKINLGSGIVNAVMDLLTTIIPIPLIARLQLPWRKRLGAIILVSLGFVVTVAGAIRSYYTWLSLLASYDETWYCYGLWLASAVEIDLGVVSASFTPVLPKCTKVFADLCMCACSSHPLRQEHWVNKLLIEERTHWESQALRFTGFLISSEWTPYAAEHQHE